jgi:hydrogenase-4 transcriptional activator
VSPFLPPLRERPGDIAELAAHFVERAAVKFGLSPAMPSPEDVQLLRTYSWPGNIRELGAVIDRAAILGEGRGLAIVAALGFGGDVPANSTKTLPRNGHHHAAPAVNAVLPFDEAIEQNIKASLRQTRGRIEGKRGAAALLEINPHTLRAKMRKLSIDWAAFREE